MFTEDEIKRARLIAKNIPPMRKSASFLDNKIFGTAKNFGRLEGNPNTFNMPMPRYNEAPPAFIAPPGPRTFMQSVGDMGRGAWRSGMGLGAAAITGQNGSHGMLENTIVRGAESVGDLGRGYWNAGKALAGGQGWTGANKALSTATDGMGSRWRGAVAAPFDRFRYNNSRDIANMHAPATWARQTWDNIWAPPHYATHRN